MDRYKIIKVVGDGAYGTVYKALNSTTGEIVAIKKMKKKFTSWEECMSLREIKSLRKLNHPNIVKLKEVVRAGDELNFIFEFLEQNAYQLIKDRTTPLPEDQLKSLIYQTLQGLAYMHKHGFFHRDLKPENLMVQQDTLKIADFGLAREIRSRPPFTDYVSTRWYRAPEILLHSTSYNSPIDIFALGAIMSELFLLRPLFPGNNEHDQIVKTCAVLGTPTQQSWPEGYRLAAKIGFIFPNYKATPLNKIIANASPEAIDLMSQMMRFDSEKRPTAAACLEHPYFSSITSAIPKEVPPPSSGSKFRVSRYNKSRQKNFGDDEKKVENVVCEAKPVSRKLSRLKSREKNVPELPEVVYAKPTLPALAYKMREEHPLGPKKAIGEEKPQEAVPFSINNPIHNILGDKKKITPGSGFPSFIQKYPALSNYKRPDFSVGPSDAAPTYKPNNKLLFDQNPAALFKFPEMGKKVDLPGLKGDLPGAPFKAPALGQLKVPQKNIYKGSVLGQASYAALSNPSKYQYGLLHHPQLNY